MQAEDLQDDEDDLQLGANEPLAQPETYSGLSQQVAGLPLEVLAATLGDSTHSPRLQTSILGPVAGRSLFTSEHESRFTALPSHSELPDAPPSHLAVSGLPPYSAAPLLQPQQYPGSITATPPHSLGPPMHPPHFPFHALQHAGAPLPAPGASLPFQALAAQPSLLPHLAAPPGFSMSSPRPIPVQPATRSRRRQLSSQGQQLSQQGQPQPATQAIPSFPALQGMPAPSTGGMSRFAPARSGSGSDGSGSGLGSLAPSAPLLAAAAPALPPTAQGLGSVASAALPPAPAAPAPQGRQVSRRKGESSVEQLYEFIINKAQGLPASSPDGVPVYDQLPEEAPGIGEVREYMAPYDGDRHYLNGSSLGAGGTKPMEVPGVQGVHVHRRYAKRCYKCISSPAGPHSWDRNRCKDHVQMVTNSTIKFLIYDSIPATAPQPGHDNWASFTMSEKSDRFGQGYACNTYYYCPSYYALYQERLADPESRKQPAAATAPVSEGRGKRLRRASSTAGTLSGAAQEEAIAAAAFAAAAAAGAGAGEGPSVDASPGDQRAADTSAGMEPFAGPSAQSPGQRTSPVSAVQTQQLLTTHPALRHGLDTLVATNQQQGPQQQAAAGIHVSTSQPPAARMIPGIEYVAPVVAPAALLAELQHQKASAGQVLQGQLAPRGTQLMVSTTEGQPSSRVESRGSGSSTSSSCLDCPAADDTTSGVGHRHAEQHRGLHSSLPILSHVTAVPDVSDSESLVATVAPVPDNQGVLSIIKAGEISHFSEMVLGTLTREPGFLRQLRESDHHHRSLLQLLLTPQGWLEEKEYWDPKELPRPVPGDTGDAQLEMVRSLKKLLGTQFHALAAQTNSTSYGSALHTAARHAGDRPCGMDLLKEVLQDAPLALVAQHTQKHFLAAHTAVRAGCREAAVAILRKSIQLVSEVPGWSEKDVLLLWYVIENDFFDKADGKRLMRELGRELGLPGKGAGPKDKHKGRYSRSVVQGLLTAYYTAQASKPT